MSDHDQNISNDQPLIPPSAPKAPGPDTDHETPASPVTSTPWPIQRVVAIGGAAFVIVGSLMPWATLNTVFGSISVNGTEGDGIITLIGGVITGILVLTKKYLASVVVSAITAAVLVYDFFNVSNIVDSGGDFASISVGWGLIVATLAGIAAIVGSAMMMQRRIVAAVGAIGVFGWAGSCCFGGGVVLASTGNLPDPVQRAVADVLEVVNIEVPRPGSSTVIAPSGLDDVVDTNINKNGDVNDDGGLGDSGNAPGASGNAGNGGNDSGVDDDAPGNSGSAPGNSGSTPGNSGNAGQRWKRQRR